MGCLSIFVSIIIFSFIVIIHELGHFIAAKKNDITVEEFAIGMGPKVFSVRKGETLYSLRLLPVGGFCQMLGEDSSNPSERAFNNKSVWQRIVVIISGVLMNIILAFVIFFVMIAMNGTCLPRVKNVSNDCPANQAGMKPGDYIYKINKIKNITL